MSYFCLQNSETVRHERKRFDTREEVEQWGREFILNLHEHMARDEQYILTVALQPRTFVLASFWPDENEPVVYLSFNFENTFVGPYYVPANKWFLDIVRINAE